MYLLFEGGGALEGVPSWQAPPPSSSCSTPRASPSPSSGTLPVPYFSRAELILSFELGLKKI